MSHLLKNVSESLRRSPFFCHFPVMQEQNEALYSLTRHCEIHLPILFNIPCLRRSESGRIPFECLSGRFRNLGAGVVDKTAGPSRRILYFMVTAICVVTLYPLGLNRPFLPASWTVPSSVHPGLGEAGPANGFFLSGLLPGCLPLPSAL